MKSKKSIRLLIIIYMIIALLLGSGCEKKWVEDSIKSLENKTSSGETTTKNDVIAITASELPIIDLPNDTNSTATTTANEENERNIPEATSTNNAVNETIAPKTTTGNTGSEINSSDSNKMESNYKGIDGLTDILENRVYIYKNADINYPQFINESNLEKIRNINALIQNEALRFNPEIQQKLDSVFVVRNYQVKTLNKDYISILFTGFTYERGYAYIYETVFTLNIDIKNEEIMQLSELINYTSLLSSLILNGEYAPYDLNLNENGVLQRALSSYDNETLLDYLVQGEVPYYLSNESIGFSLKVQNVYGDHIEMEVKYTDINEICKGKMNEIISSLSENF